MKKFKRIIINAISFVIAMLLLISPLEVLAGTANTANVIESSNKYVDGDSVFYLSHADVQVDDENYYPETANRFEEDKYNQSIDYEYQSSMSKSSDSIPGDPMVYYTQKWLNQEYGNVSGFGSVEENGKTGWNVIYGLLRALQHELGITDLTDDKDLDAWSTWLNERKGSEKYNPFADLNNDGYINGKDYAMLLVEFNNKTSDDINKIIEKAENRNEQ